MRQVWISKVGGPEVLQVREAPDPEPKAGEVRIRVAFCGVNFADIMARQGLYPDAPKLPAVVGYEVSGTVDKVGAGVDERMVGKTVLSFTRFGGYSDAVCVEAEQALALPEGMSAEEGAAIPVVYITAYHMLIANGSPANGDKVLIHQAAGGVGLAALDICRMLGVETYGTASKPKHDFLRERGLDHPIDYRNEDFEKVVFDLTEGRGVNLILDPVGGDSWRKGWNILAPTGRLIMFGFSSMAGKGSSLRKVITGLVRTPWLKFNPMALMNENKGIAGANLGHLWHEALMLRGWMERILEWYGQGHIRPQIDSVFSFDDAGKAHSRIEDRKNIGKVLLRP